MNSRKKEILSLLSKQSGGMTAADVAEKLMIDRSNASRYLSDLQKKQLIKKTSGRPVVYSVISEEKDESKVHVDHSTDVTFDKLVGENDSLNLSIQQAKAAILYPPKGLHTIIFGETGTGKSMFAECMYHFAIESETLASDAPFISFNCADYSQNPQLLFGHIFGIKKGAYTGAAEDSPGLIAKADGGILFLDEIHRLPPEGQEMLFTFIDKGTYRPLGESAQQHQASVQIIGATTESSDSFLTTFNRRIPMAITLPNLASRSLDERYEIISLFIQQEANRLNQQIKVEREALAAFMLYDAEGNIGQVKRDLKLVCARAFLKYRTHKEAEMIIRNKDLSLQVQKGLLKIKELPEHPDYFFDKKSSYLTFEPGFEKIVWSQDPERDMQVYNTIEEKVATLAESVEGVDLEMLISKDVDKYFQTYVTNLVQVKVPKDLLPEKIWRLTNQLYDVAEDRLERTYSEQARFAFALHLQSTIERIKEGHTIVHPDLNTIRKNLKNEFQVAIDLSSLLEEQEQIEVPFDEIGFISMFLSIDLGVKERIKEKNVGVLLLMHGKSTASSMLETTQELLGTTDGWAMDMPLTIDVQQMYERVLHFVREKQIELKNGLLLLTDMGSLNTFGQLLSEETGIPTRAISMTSTMLVMEALRMSSNGHGLEEIYRSIQTAFEATVREQFKPVPSLKGKGQKAVIVACFTGEGVAAKLYERILPIVDQKEVKVIQMQFLEREAFKRRIDELSETYEIKAIAGTVDISYQNIPFFSVYDIFDEEKFSMLQRIIENEVPLEKVIRSLEKSLTLVTHIERLVPMLQTSTQQIQSELSLVIEPGVEAGIMIHIAFMVDALLRREHPRKFIGLEAFVKRNRLAVETIRAHMIPIERMYQVAIVEDEVAFLAQMFLENRINAEKAVTH